MVTSTFYHCFVVPGYVQEIKELLFTMTSEKDMSQLKAVFEKYNEDIPEPLTSQFPDQANKEEAVKRFNERTQKENTKLYPSGEHNVII